MKVIKGLILFVFVVLGASSCFDPPEFPIEPEIDLATVYFLDNADISENDTLMLSLTFKDGDGDLGLDPSETNPPFHARNYFLAKDGVLHPVAIYTGATNENPPRIFSPVLDVQPDQNGKLATIQTRDLGYDIPPLEFPYTCSNYTRLTDSLYLLERDVRILDATHTITQTIPIGETNLLKISNSNFYYETNPDQYNITVEFQMQDPNGVTYTTFDWREELCTTFDGRFPVLFDDDDSDTPLDGTLHYAMVSVGFRQLFSTKTLRLKVQIKDRALHSSNITYTDPFTLDQVTR